MGWTKALRVYQLLFLPLAVITAPTKPYHGIEGEETDSKLNQILEKVNEISTKVNKIYCGVTKGCAGEVYQYPYVYLQNGDYPWGMYTYPVGEGDGSGDSGDDDWMKEWGENPSSGDGESVYVFYRNSKAVERKDIIRVTFGEGLDGGEWTSKEKCPEHSLIRSLQPLLGGTTSPVTQEFIPDRLYALQTMCHDPSQDQSSLLFSLAGIAPMKAVWMPPSSCPEGYFVSALYVESEPDSPLPVILLGCSKDDSGDIISSQSPVGTEEHPPEWTAACPVGKAFCSIGVMTLMGQKGVKAVELDCCEIPKEYYSPGSVWTTNPEGNPDMTATDMK